MLKRRSWAVMGKLQSQTLLVSKGRAQSKTY